MPFFPMTQIPVINLISPKETYELFAAKKQLPNACVKEMSSTLLQHRNSDT